MTTIPDSLPVCPSWCRRCYLDTDGTRYHSSEDVPLPGEGYARAIAVQRHDGDVEAIAVQVYGSEDREHTLAEAREFALALLAFTQRHGLEFAR